MKLYNLKDTKSFLETLDKCKGTIEVVTKEGDRLNLKSKLCQYVALTKLFNTDSTIIDELEIIAYDPEDVILLFEYMKGAK